VGIKDEFYKELAVRCKSVRKKILDMSLNCDGPVHIGGGLSMVELMVVLYGKVLNYNPKFPSWEGRDRFILSKGHGVLGFFPVLAEFDVISEEQLKSFKTNGSDLIAHPIQNLDLGIESSNGSLGHGLSFGVGMSLAARISNSKYRTFVLMGDGECNEGSVWEAAMCASHYALNSLTVIVDFNGLQSDGKSSEIVNSDFLADKWRSFGWEVIEIDGHSIPQIVQAFEDKLSGERPSAIIAKTVKGKGISFMENNNEWHHNRLTQLRYDQAVLELESSK
jgi:transketolase